MRNDDGHLVVLVAKGLLDLEACGAKAGEINPRRPAGRAWEIVEDVDVVRDARPVLVDEHSAGDVALRASVAVDSREYLALDGAEGQWDLSPGAELEGAAGRFGQGLEALAENERVPAALASQKSSDGICGRWCGNRRPSTAPERGRTEAVEGLVDRPAEELSLLPATVCVSIHHKNLSKLTNGRYQRPLPRPGSALVPDPR